MNYYFFLIRIIQHHSNIRFSQAEHPRSIEKVLLFLYEKYQSSDFTILSSYVSPAIEPKTPIPPLIPAFNSGCSE